MKGNVLTLAPEEQFDELRNSVARSFNKLRGRIDVTTAQKWIGNSPALDNFFEGLLPSAVVLAKPIEKFAYSLILELSRFPTVIITRLG